MKLNHNQLLTLYIALRAICKLNGVIRRFLFLASNGTDYRTVWLHAVLRVSGLCARSAPENLSNSQSVGARAKQLPLSNPALGQQNQAIQISNPVWAREGLLLATRYYLY